MERRLYRWNNKLLYLVFTTCFRKIANIFASQGAPPAPTPAANFDTSFASVVVTGGKFATGVNIDTSGKFATGVNNDGGK
jgi:hypothetical protein